MKFCITLSNVRLTLFSVVEWRKIHCQLHWALVSVSQNACWYFQKIMKSSPLKACCSCKPAFCLPSKWLKQGVPQRGSWSPPWSSTNCHKRPGETLTDGHSPLTKKPVLSPIVYWYTGVWSHDLGLFLAPLYLYKTDKLGLEGERLD